MVTRTLENSTGVGGMIPVSDVPLLAEEVRAVIDSSGVDHELREFCGQLDRLCRAAITESNPIVYT